MFRSCYNSYSSHNGFYRILSPTGDISRSRWPDRVHAPCHELGPNCQQSKPRSHSQRSLCSWKKHASRTDDGQTGALSLQIVESHRWKYVWIVSILFPLFQPLGEILAFAVQCYCNKKFCNMGRFRSVYGPDSREEAAISRLSCCTTKHNRVFAQHHHLKENFFKCLFRNDYY